MVQLTQALCLKYEHVNKNLRNWAPLGHRTRLWTNLGQRRASRPLCALKSQTLDRGLRISYLKKKISKLVSFVSFCGGNLDLYSKKNLISDYCKLVWRTPDCELLPLSSISWMHMSTTMGRVVLWALTSVVRSQLNTFLILRRSGWQSLGTSLEHCLCTFSPQSRWTRGR